MALYILQPGLQPLGQFDFLDTDLDNVVGGELGTWDEAGRANTSTEKAAADVLDGYVADLVDVGTAAASRAQCWRPRVLISAPYGHIHDPSGKSGPPGSLLEQQAQQ